MPHLPRLIAPSELPAVAQLRHDAWHETHAPYVPAELIALRTAPDFLRRLNDMGDGARTIGAPNAPLGFCAIDGDQMDQLFLAPAARGTGAAARLLTDAEDRLRAAGCTVAHLDCLKENAPAIRFYEKAGWTAEGVQQVDLNTSAGPFRIDCLVFSKRLV